MVTYYQLKQEKQKLYNDFSSNNIYWIFASTDEALAEELKKLGLNRSDVLSIGMGGYLKKEALNDYKKLLKKLKDITEKIKDDDELLKDGLRHELWNHEFIITYDASDALTVFGFTYEDVQKDERLKRILNEAINEYLKEMEEF